MRRLPFWALWSTLRKANCCCGGDSTLAKLGSFGSIGKISILEVGWPSLLGHGPDTKRGGSVDVVVSGDDSERLMIGEQP